MRRIEIGGSHSVWAFPVLLMVALPPALSSSQELIDSRDGRGYPTVEIGGMTWMARNLAFAQPGSFCYENRPEYCDLHGRLYRWEEAVAACPVGWHLASEIEWQALEVAMGIPFLELEQTRNRGTVQGARLKEGGDSGFEAQYGGWRGYQDGAFDALGRAGAYWTSTEADPAHAWHRDIDTGDDMIYRSPVVKHYALSVRCVRNRYTVDEYSGNDIGPAWSPAGGVIAYLSDRDADPVDGEPSFNVFVLDLKTKRELRLTDNDAAEADLAWSPDGERLAFRTSRDGNDEIYLMDRDGGQAVNLTRHAAKDSAPAFSPDGSRLAFVSDREGDEEIFLMRADGTEIVQLTHHPAADYSPSWSPDGQWLAFVSARDGNPDVYRIRIDGSRIDRVTDAPEADLHPRWSPDGEWIALTSVDEAASRASVVLIRPDGTDRQIWRSGVDGGNVSWGPEGRELAFGAPSEPQDGTAAVRSRIFLGVVGGSEPERITGRMAGTFE